MKYLDAKIYKNKEGDDICLKDTIPNNVSEEDKIINKLFVENLLNILNEKEKTVIKNRYYEDMKQSQISKHMGISQVQVSRLEKKSLHKMKKYILN